MTHEESKFILSAYRPSGQDALDPAFAEPLKRLEIDAELRAWMDKQLSFDRAVAERVRSVAPPPQLRMSILAGARLEPVSSRFAWAWAIAACLTLAALVAATRPSWRARSATREVAAFALADTNEALHGGRGQQLTHWQQVLSAAPDPTRVGLPSAFNALAADGCRIIDVNGRRGIEICFGRVGETYHLYMVEVPGSGTREPALAADSGGHTLTWASDGYVFALSGGDTPAARAWLSRVSEGGA